MSLCWASAVIDCSGRVFIVVQVCVVVGREQHCSHGLHG